MLTTLGRGWGSVDCCSTLTVKCCSPPKTRINLVSGGRKKSSVPFTWIITFRSVVPVNWDKQVSRRHNKATIAATIGIGISGADALTFSSCINRHSLLSWGILLMILFCQPALLCWHIRRYCSTNHPNTSRCSIPSLHVLIPITPVFRCPMFSLS